MASWLDNWKSQYPYASSMYGVYQPLIGWRSKRKQQRADNERIAKIRQVISSMVGDQRYVKQLGSAPRPLSPAEQLPPRLHGFLGEVASQRIYAANLDFTSKNQRPPTTTEEWTSVVESANLTSLVTDVTRRAASAERALIGLDAARTSTSEHSQAALSAPYLAHEATVAGVMQYLAKESPGALAAAMRPSVPLPLQLLPWVDPLANFDPERQLAFLSPIGPMQLYRQYFFELDTLLGPPVGHVWVSPGGSLEVFEVHTLRSTTVRDEIRESSSTSRTETQLNTSDELASSVTNQNSQNMAMGVSVNAGVSMLVFHSSASANFNMQQAKQTTDQETHKATRAQTQKAASEVRQNFRTEFKTTLDQTDSVSKRYVLSNSSPNVVNYELRRKMRRIAVQLQHIGTRLCWQVYVDEPGANLGIAELVHVAQPADLSNSQPPTAPAVLMPLEQSMTVTIPFTGLRVNGQVNTDRGEDYIKGAYQLMAPNGVEQIPAIKHTFPVPAVPPAAGYTLAGPSSIEMESFKGTDNPSSKDAYIIPSFTIHPDGTSFDVNLDQVNFDDNHSLLLNLHLVWQPPSQAKQLADYQDALNAYNNQVQQQQHAAYVQNVRDRINAAGVVKKRFSDDLREEERIAIYRALLQQLVAMGDPGDLHVTSELLRSVFDLDSMLYFVAPDYWKPKRAQRQQLDTSYASSKAKPKLNLSPTAALAMSPSSAIAAAVAAGGGSAIAEPTPAPDVADANGLNSHDLIAWGGERQRQRANYLVTEDSTPAPLGASLGWTLQLDADDRRNAFLNAPWVKAVIPVQPGHEQAAINWLRRAHVEGSDGLGDPPIDQSAPTVLAALNKLADDLSTSNTDPKNLAASEQVFENGFDPLEGGIKLDQNPYTVFDQWIEVMPTDQVVAVDYTPPPVGPPAAQSNAALKGS